MKKIHLNFLGLIFIVVLSGNTGLFAQQIVIKNSGTNLQSTLNNEHHFDENHYTRILNNDDSRIYVTNTSFKQDNPERNVLNDVTVNINVIPDPSIGYNVIVIAFIDEDGQVVNYYIWEGTNPVVAELPIGIYDIMTFFIEAQNHIVIKEQIEIEEGSEINIDVAEAANYVSLKTYDENGDSLEPGIMNPDSGEPSWMLFGNTFYLNPANEPIVFFSFTFDQNEPLNGEPAWNFYINDVSSRYSALQMMIASGLSDNRHYALKFEPLTGVNESVEMENNPEDWVYHKEKLRLGGSNPPETVYPSFAFNTGYNGVYSNNLTYIWSNYFNPQEDDFNIYLNNPVDDNPLNLLVNTGMKINPFDTSNKGSFLIKEGDDVIYTSDGDLSLFFRENGKPLLLPLHPKFSFKSSENPDLVQGENTPIIVTRSILQNDYNSVTFDYFGRFGEMRSSDLSATSVEVIQNGNIIFSGIWDDYINFVLPTFGQFEITIINTYPEIDGLAGSNTTKLSYDADEQDAPPTLQKLQFRDSSSKMTDRFVSASEGTVRLAAGDFQFSEENNYLEYNPGNTIEFYYSLYGQNNWTELELTEDPEYFQSPGVGDYYEASLETVVVPEENSWFDVKTICTDASGNKQEQVISPAFKVEQTTLGIEEINQTSFAVYPNPFTKELNIKLPETVKGNYIFKVSDLTGKTVYTNVQSEKSFVWNGSSLQKGAYILSIESDGKVVAKKVIKK